MAPGLLKDMRTHDMRKVVATWVSEAGFADDVVSMILHHGPKGITGTHYNFASHEAKVRPALQAWADFLTGQAIAGAKVVPFAARA